MEIKMENTKKKWRIQKKNGKKKNKEWKNDKEKKKNRKKLLNYDHLDKICITKYNYKQNWRWEELVTKSVPLTIVCSRSSLQPSS